MIGFVLLLFYRDFETLLLLIIWVFVRYVIGIFLSVWTLSQFGIILLTRFEQSFLEYINKAEVYQEKNILIIKVLEIDLWRSYFFDKYGTKTGCVQTNTFSCIFEGF